MKAGNSAKRRFAIYTLGCKVNQYESETIASALMEKGWIQNNTAESTDLFIINTCTVTGKAAMQARQSIRKAIRMYPDACIVVTGCYAQTEPLEIQNIEGVHYIISQSDKHRLPDIIHHTALDHFYSSGDKALIVWSDIEKTRYFHADKVPMTNHRTRPFLKIQDGCNAFCTYCIVPYARGRSRSMPVDKVLENIRNINQAGFFEVVLTGTHLGCFGQDLSPKTSLYHLLTKIHEETSFPRIRLSSIEPKEITEEMITLTANSFGLCHHFHIPLQSGDDEILKKMNRPYTRVYFKQLVEQIHNIIPDCAIGVDILVGFPGETKTAFENTLHLIEALPITYLHVFPFSPRKGTPAAKFPNHISPPVIKERSQKLRELGLKKKRTFYQKLIGEKVDVLIEETRSSETGMLKGLTSNYAPVLIEGDDSLKNTMITVTIDGIVQTENGTSVSCVGEAKGLSEKDLRLGKSEGLR